MKSMKKLLSCMLMVCALVLSSGTTVQATQMTGTNIDETVVETINPVILVEEYEVTNEKIVPGADFTLKLLLKNCSKRDVHEVMIDISNPDGVAPVYGTVSQIFVGDIAAGKTKLVEFQYNSYTSITEEALDFKVTILSDSPTNYITIRVPVGVDSPFSVISTSIPSKAIAGESIPAALSFKVLGEENISNVTMVLKVNEEEQKSVIGIVTPGMTKSQNMSFQLDTPGEHAVEVLLEYVDEVGVQQSLSVGTVVVAVEEGKGEAVQEQPNVVAPEPEENEGTNNLVVMGISGMLILVIFSTIVFIVSRKRK